MQTIAKKGLPIRVVIRPSDGIPVYFLETKGKDGRWHKRTWTADVKLFREILSQLTKEVDI